MSDQGSQPDPRNKPPCLREDALAVLLRLREADHEAYFAGGCVRDTLMGQEPADWDIATDAVPQRVRSLFSSTQAVGAAFGVVLVRHGSSVVEVATFRADGTYEDGRRPSAVHFTSAQEPPLVVLNVEQSADRMRFTLAHELGHLVMHHDQPTQTMEQEANEFASAFLMPTRDIRPYFARRIDLRLLAELKPVWRVSMASLLMRARSLGLLAYNQERYLWQQFSIAKIRQSEPPELDFAAETATVLPELLNAHICELGYSITDLASLLHVQPPELAILYGLIIKQDSRPPHLRIVK